MNYKKTLVASFVGYIVQAVVNNFAPLLFLLFRQEWGLKVDQVAFLATFNFGIQLMIDLLSSRFVHRIGYRVSIVLAHSCAAVGMAGLAFLPRVLPSPYLGLLVSIFFYAIGGGLIEVLVSPIVEACPTKRKEAVMSLLHSFYCWGQMAVVAVATLFFTLAGISHWRMLAVLLALIPAVNAVAFCVVPIWTLEEEAGERVSVKKLFTMPLFWFFLLLMLCSGASELSVSQWASALAEAGLGVSKTVGDLAGPMFFAAMMGISRLLYAKYSERLSLEYAMLGSGILCVVSYLMISLAPWAWVGLLGCGVCGFSVGVMWPGTYSLAAKQLRGGGTVMFSLLALAGDAGCSSGPTLVGLVSGAFGDQYRLGVLAAVVFPLLLVAGMAAMLRKPAR